MRYLLTLISIVILSLIIPSSVNAATYYVSTTGSDTNSGTQSSPFKTFSKAISRLVPGDELQIYGGTYTEELILSKSGTATQPITVRSMSGQKVILDAQKQHLQAILIPGSSSYINISGLEVTGASSAGMLISGNNLNISNIDSHHNYEFGYRVKGSDIVIEHSICRDNVLENIDGKYGDAGGWGSCLKTAPNAQHLTIRNNHIYNNWGEGLIIGQSNDSVAYDNLVHDNYSANIYIGNAFNIDVYRNMTYSTNPEYFRSGRPSTCLSASEEITINPNWGAQLHNIRVFNNIAYGCKMGMGYTYSEVANNGCENCLFAYNTLVDTGGVKVIAGTKNSVVLKNNLIIGGSITVASGVTQSNNILSNLATINNHFSVTPGTLPESFRLKSTSSAIGAASAISGIIEDYERKIRSSPYDIGAIEYQSGSTPQYNIADLEPDGDVDLFDFNALVNHFGETGIDGWIRADIIKNGAVDLFDFNKLVENFGK